MSFKVIGLNHIGLAPKDSKVASHFFKTLLELPLEGEEEVSSQKVNTIMFSSTAESQNPAATRLEILEPTSSDSPIQKFLDKKGSGVHHLALTVTNVQAAIDHLLKNEIIMIDESPRPGAHNTSIAFVHPKSTGGLLVELVQQL